MTNQVWIPLVEVPLARPVKICHKIYKILITSTIDFDTKSKINYTKRVVTKENQKMSGRGGYRRGAGRKAVWQDQETQTIRVPVALKDQLLDIGKGLDGGQEFYDGKTCAELREVLQTWEAKCQENEESPEWQPVRQLLDDIQAVLAKRPVKARRRRRFRHGCNAATCDQDVNL